MVIAPIYVESDYFTGQISEVDGSDSQKQWLSNPFVNGLGRFLTCKLNIYPVIFDRLKFSHRLAV